jgi:hypothetical protein
MTVRGEVDEQDPPMTLTASGGVPDDGPLVGSGYPAAVLADRDDEEND